MTLARVRAALLIALALASACTRDHKQPAPAEKPKLLLLTSLPLVFGEGFSLDGGSPALSALHERYDVVPISVTSPAELRKGHFLLMAQPLAQTAENLVALDDWVRGGGRLMLLADPLLEWPSERRLTDPLRPPPIFMDTGLLQHWGLRLDAPERRGPQTRELGGRTILTASPGALAGSCQISRDRLMAECAVGKGRAAIVADADFLDVDRLDGPADDNLAGLLAELAKLARK
jgi:hypothetical protein